MSRRRTSWRVRVTHQALAELAPAIWPPHADFTGLGWAMLPSSGLWRRRDGTLSARLAYRQGDRATSMVVNVTGLAPAILSLPPGAA